jgi:PTS system cellobiose-specific IIB component
MRLDLSVDYLDDLGLRDFEDEPFDLILLAPQVGFMRKRIAGKVERFGTAVERLDPMAFGMMDGEKLVGQIREALAARPAKV